MIKATNVGGRPRGRKKTSKIEVSIEPEIKEQFMTILSSEGMTASGKICNWIREYIKNHGEEITL
jgi:hypothetical protein